MHTSEAARGLGVGRAIVDHILAFAAERNYTRVSLETGAMDAFAPAPFALLEAGLCPCEPFGDYTGNRHSVCMTIDLS